MRKPLAPIELRYFPDPYPNEIFTSLWIRMRWHQGDRAASLRSDFHNWQPPLVFHPTWVADLNSMKRAAPAAWPFSVQETIQKHCVFPFFSPFVPPDVRENQFKWAERRNEGHINEGIYPPSARFVRELDATGELKSCPTCVREQVAKFGEPYLDRNHHLPGFRICLKHRLPLAKVGVLASPSVTALKERLLELGETAVETTVVPPHSLIDFLQTSIATLLARSVDHQEILDFHPLFRIQLLLKGFNTMEKTRQLPAALREAYQELLPFIQIGGWADSVIINLWRGRPFLPIAHLVLLHFLDLTLDDAFRHANGLLWKCPNILSDCGLAKVTPSSKIARVPLLACPSCGLTADVYPSTPIGTRAEIYRLRDLGNDLRSKVLQLHEQNVGLRKIAKQTGMPRRAIWEVFRNTPAHAPPHADQVVRAREKNRAILLEWMQKHPKGKRTDFKLAEKNAYNWLLAYDRDWFAANAPVSRRTGNTSDSMRSKISRRGTKHKTNW